MTIRSMAISGGKGAARRPASQLDTSSHQVPVAGRTCSGRCPGRTAPDGWNQRGTARTGWGLMKGAATALAAVLFLSAWPAWPQVLSDDDLQLKPMPADIFTPPKDKAFTAKIDSLINRLGAPKFEDRQAAAAELLQIGLPAMAQLRASFARTDDLEVQMRIEEVVRQAYFNHHVFDDNGFLGISMTPYESVRARNGVIPRGRGQLQQRQRVQTHLPPGTVAVVVSAVLPNTAAERGGLQAGDVIVAVNDKPLEGHAERANETMSKSIRTNPPGTTLVLTVMRGTEELQLEVTLGRTPEANARGRGATSVIGTTQLYRKAHENFPAWWSEHYGPTAVSLSKESQE